MRNLTKEERELLASAIVWTRRTNFTDAERIRLHALLRLLSPTRWDGTHGAFRVLPVALQREIRADERSREMEREHLKQFEGEES